MSQPWVFWDVKEYLGVFLCRYSKHFGFGIYCSVEIKYIYILIANSLKLTCNIDFWPFLSCDANFMTTRTIEDERKSCKV